MRRRTHITHRGHHAMSLSRWESIGIQFLVPALLIALAAFVVGEYAHQKFPEISIPYFLSALGASLTRITFAYIVSLIVGVALGLWSLMSPRAERLLLPIWDVLESLPVLVFFPVIITAFAAMSGYSLAAIAIMALSMVWNIVFSTIGGLRVIPRDIHAVPFIFKLTPLQRLEHVILPALIPSLVTGSLLAWAEGWNMLMVAEVIHTYVPSASQSSDLFGIGSILVHASASGDMHAFIAAVGVMVAVVAILNVFLWQPLLSYSARFKFE